MKHTHRYGFSLVELSLRARGWAKPRTSRVPQGFSLVELSIVLVILGLLTGGVLTGQSLIRASELRGVTTEYQRYVSAVQSFRDKYFALPGDMANAQSFWGDNNTSCANAATPNATPGTCNGNGDGWINSSAAAANATAEAFQFFNQLAYAGLIEGNYPGTWSAGATASFGSEWPRSKLGGVSGWYVNFAINYPGDAWAYALDYGNFFEVSGVGVGVLKPEEAWNIDTKMDDGKPAQGSVVARYWNNACAAADDGTHANNDLVASYRLTDSTKQCNLIFRKAF